ncbi:MAG: heme anaerobic degradation radical SAM methyltransferase ChuW/HutW [Deltaproteobacteria bacterium]|nr:MAG: heme anaerobic degradation radical SAM methyltransferase ChuW/HutW [Deltaproteobacteria bacterium]
MKWTEEAKKAFEAVPPFVRPVAKKGVEAYARSMGQKIITPEFLKDAKKNLMGRHGIKSTDSSVNREEPDRKATVPTHQYPNGFFAGEGVDPLKYAFDRKISVHAGAGGQPLPAEEALPAWQALCNKPDSSPRRTVYIHIPFCQSRCLYCGFFMHTLRQGDSNRYTDALLKEIEQVSGLSAVISHPIHAVYLGGGTPTALDAGDLQRLIEAVCRLFPLADDCEITLEGRVADFGQDKMQACMVGGANRFSIGVQSFNTKVRQDVGRIADRAEILKMLTTLTDLDNGAVIIDLIYGLPGQTMVIWEDDLRTLIEETRLDGADLYQLNVFKGSPLSRAVDQGKLPSPADIPTQAEMFLKGRKMMTAARFRRLSMSHWGRTPRERNRYNKFIRYGATCIPLGCGAGGRLHGHYFFQEGNLKTYYKRVNAGEKPVATAILLPAYSPLFRNLVGQMENGRVNLAVLGKKHGFDLEAVFSPLLEQWERAGLIRSLGEGWIELTVAGEFWNVNLAQALIDYFQHYRFSDI